MIGTLGFPKKPNRVGEPKPGLKSVAVRVADRMR
jgi:hypothetical protein